VAATVEALEKSVAYWQREAARDNALAKDGAIAEAQAERTVNQVDEIKGQLNAAREKRNALSHTIRALSWKKAQFTAQLDYFNLTAPFDGVVSRRMADPGDLASPGKPLITVEDRSRLMLAFDVPQKDLDRVHERLSVSWRFAGKSFSANLSHLYPTLSEAKMVRAEVYIDGPDMAVPTMGAYVPMTVQVTKFKNVILVPMDCLIDHSGKTPYVYRVQDERITVLKVKVLGNNSKQAAVEGLNPDDTLVINTFLGWATLADGMSVEVAK